VSSIMIYNALDVSAAFSKISDIRFKLEEQPEWASEDYSYAVIKDLKVPDIYWDVEAEEYISCSPVVAEFDEIMVSELSVTIAAEDRLVEIDKQGEENTNLSVSEIVILGGAKQ